MESAKESYKNALEIWEQEVQNLQDRIDGKEVLVEEAIEEE